MSSPTHKCKCGCSYREERWLQLCEKHEAEWSETHQRWAEERKQQQDLDEVLS